MELISYFPVMKLMGKKLLNFVNYFKLKNFNFKDSIYKKGDPINSVYFIIEGDVSFELQLDESKEGQENKKGRRKEKEGAAVSVCSVSSRSYFGEEEVLFKSTYRSHTAKVISSNCATLVLSKDKF